MPAKSAVRLLPWFLSFGLLFLFLGAQVFSQAPGMFSGPVITAMLAIAASRATPMVFGSLSGIVCERSGVVQIGIEGMMLVAAFFAFAVQIATHNLVIALLAAVLASVVLAAFHAMMSITFQVNQIISGTVVNIFAVGLTGYLNRQLPLDDSAINAAVFPRLPVPILADLPLVGRILFSHQPLTYAAFLLPLMAHIWLFHTSWGLRTRAVGEHPLAADTAGIDVHRIRYLNVLVGGALAGLGGAYFTLESVPNFEPLMTNGRGFIALAAMIFGKWTPLGAWGGALLFGAAEALPVALQIQGIGVNYFLVGLLPYVLTIVVLAGAVGRTSPPASIGMPYERR